MNKRLEETKEYLDKFEAVKEYLQLQEQAKRIKERMDVIKKAITEEIKSKGPVVYEDKKFVIKERISYTYNPTKLKQAVGEDVAKLIIREEIDTKKLQGLVKAGIVPKEALEPAKEVSRTIEALVIKKVKEANND